MSNHMNDDDKLNALKQTQTLAPSEAARRRALDAAMLAFDAEQTSQKKAAQGNPITQRLRSIFANAKGNWTMDNRLSYGLGTAAVALLLLPFGYQLYTSTAITPIGVRLASWWSGITISSSAPPANGAARFRMPRMWRRMCASSSPRS